MYAVEVGSASTIDVPTSMTIGKSNYVTLRLLKQQFERL
jgi:hypothetical protein